MAETDCKNALLTFDLYGTNPKSVNGNTRNPEATTAVNGALAPGTGSTWTPASTHAWTSSAPGSDTPGVPASVTTAIESPAASLAGNRGIRSWEVCSCKVGVGVEIPCGVSSVGVRGVVSGAGRCT